MEEVLRVLEFDWQDPLRCTNVEQGFRRAGVPFEDGARRRVAEAILAGGRLSELVRWHPSAYVLTNEERLVARGVLRVLEPEAGSKRSELVAGVAALLKRPAEQIASALDALQWVGFLDARGATLRLSARSSEYLEGVGFYFHEVQAGAEWFNVNCFHDFVLLTSPLYRARRLRRLERRRNAPGMTPKMLQFLQGIARENLVQKPYDRGRVSLRDACAECTREIRLTVEDAELVDVQPAGAWHVRGGGCGVNNLFCGPACAERWTAARSSLGQGERGPIPDLWTGA